MTKFPGNQVPQFPTFSSHVNNNNNNNIWHLYSALQRTQRFYITDTVHFRQCNYVAEQLISASCDIQTHRTGHTDWETGSSLSHGSFA